MRRTSWDTLPDEVERVRERFAQWRQTRPGRSRIPEPLWAEAAQLARSHGVHPIARALGLNDHALKSRTLMAGENDPSSAAAGPTVTLSSPSIARAAPNPAPPGFVELAWPAPPAASAATEPAPARCMVELIHPGGSKMTITLDGPTREADIPSGVDLAGLVQAFWSRRG
jgi:hypothetical protein